MSSTQMSSSNALAVKLWGKKGWYNIGMQTAFGYAFGRGAVFFAEDLMGGKARGDNITYDYTNKLTGIPVGEGGTLDGNEEALNLGNFQLAMNVTRVGVLSPNEDTIEQQRTNVPFMKRAGELIPARHSELVDTSFFYQLAGANPTSFTLNGTTWASTATKLFVQGHNTPVAPSTGRIVRANAAATDEALTSSDKFTLDLIDYALEANARSDQPIEPLSDGTYDLFCSPEQIVDIKQDTVGKIQWFNAELSKIMRTDKNEFENPMRNGMIFIGTYSNVNIYQAGRVAYGVNSSTSAVITTVRRAVLVGKNAVTFGSPFGGRVTDENVPLRMSDQLKDYGYYKGIEGRLIYGLKKTVPTNGIDVGVFVLSTYAASHS
jgi:Protein of unknown function (DUF4043)